MEKKVEAKEAPRPHDSMRIAWVAVEPRSVPQCATQSGPEIYVIRPIGRGETMAPNELNVHCPITQSWVSHGFRMFHSKLSPCTRGLIHPTHFE